MPLAAWLKQFFLKEKKYGSKDRKQISHLVYCFYRLGHAYQHLDIEERLLLGIFLCSSSEQFILRQLRHEWNEKISLTIKEKLSFISLNENVSAIFPFCSLVSKEISCDDLSLSFLDQPDLFIRIRPGYEIPVKQKLEDASLVYREVNETCLALPNGSKMESVLEIGKEVVVQDRNSQKTLDALHGVLAKDRTIDVWDCCAASGGKSLLLYDRFSNVRITVSDIRRSILHNLEARFDRAGIREYHSFVHDLSSKPFAGKFDLVICDAPCSGSGTWGRTPEQLYFFRQERAGHYATLQKRIAMNAVHSLKKGGYFIYITCSVFGQENEEVVDHLCQHTNLQLISSNYLRGMGQKADTLFTALFGAV